MKRRWLPQWVTEYSDRHGKRRYRFRRKGFATYHFCGEPGSEGFRAEYDACKRGEAAPPLEPGRDRTAPGSFDDLIVRFYSSAAFLAPGERTQAVYRGVLERFRAEHGHRLVRDLEAKHVAAMMDKRHKTPTAANILRKTLARVVDHGILLGMRANNPLRSVKPFRIKSKGYHTWTEAEIAAFELRHPLGSKARLALALMLWTGQRRGDAIRMGRQHISDKRLRVTQQKTGATVSIPVMPALAEAIMASGAGALVFLVTARGAPFTAAGFGNWFRDRCNEAGLPQCASHGLRKAASRRFAEAGCSNQQIKAWTGHESDSEVARYTRDADKLAMADEAGRKLSEWMANPDSGFANSPAKLLREAD